MPEPVTIRLRAFDKVLRQLEDSSSPLKDRIFKRIGMIYRGWAQERFDIFSKGGGDWAPLSPRTIMARYDRPAERVKQTAKSFGIGASNSYYQTYADYERALMRAARRSPFFAAREARQRYEAVVATAGKKSRSLARQAQREIEKGNARKAYKLLARAEAVRAPIHRSAKSLARKAHSAQRAFAMAKILRDTGTLFNALSFATAPGALERIEPNRVVLGYGGSARHKSSESESIAEIAERHQTGGKGLPRRKIIVSPPASVSRQMCEAALDLIAKEIR